MIGKDRDFYVKRRGINLQHKIVIRFNELDEDCYGEAQRKNN